MCCTYPALNDWTFHRKSLCHALTKEFHQQYDTAISTCDKHLAGSHVGAMLLDYEVALRYIFGFHALGKSLHIDFTQGESCSADNDYYYYYLFSHSQ